MYCGGTYYRLCTGNTWYLLNPTNNPTVCLLFRTNLPLLGTSHKESPADPDPSSVLADCLPAYLLVSRPTATEMDSELVVKLVSEILGPASHPQLRLVSRRCRDALAAVPCEILRVEDYVTSVSLIEWAWDALDMEPSTEITEAAA
jgi:hypothetical protein